MEDRIQDPGLGSAFGAGCRHLKMVSPGGRDLEPHAQAQCVLRLAAAGFDPCPQRTEPSACALAPRSCGACWAAP